MNTTDSDIINRPVKNIFEFLFRQNILSVVLIAIVANGYSNIPGVNALLIKVFANYHLRFLITFILLFQISDNIKDSLIWSSVVNIILYFIEKNYKKNIKQ